MVCSLYCESVSLRRENLNDWVKIKTKKSKLLMIILTPALNMKIFVPLNMMLTIRMQDQSLLVTMICNNYLLSCEINELLTFHLYKSNHTYVWPMCYLSVILLFPAKQRFISSTGIIEDSSLHTLAQESSFQSQNWHFFILYVTQLFIVNAAMCRSSTFVFPILGTNIWCQKKIDSLFVLTLK